MRSDQRIARLGSIGLSALIPAPYGILDWTTCGAVMVRLTDQRS